MCRPLLSNYSAAPRYARAAATACAAIAAFAALAGPSARIASAGETDDPLTVRLLTIGPGAAIYERFGHNAIVIDDRGRNISVAYNFGIFSFEERNFILRFVQGRMYYRLEPWDTAATIRMYVEEGRDIWAQTLNLTPAQKRELLLRLERNARPENAAYLYDYYTDNCSTRVRDALDAVLAGALSAALKPVPAGTTFRHHTRRSLAGDPLIYAGLELLLGRGVDRPLSAWEEAYMPLSLQGHLRRVSVADDAGRTVPLVAAETQLYAGGRFVDRPAPPRPMPWFLAAGVVAGAAMAATAAIAGAKRVARIALGTVAAAWCFLAGGGGVCVAILWLFTSHVAAWHNENLLQFNPLALPLTVLMPAAIAGRALAARCVAPLAVAVLACSLLGLVLKLLPAFHQSNGCIIALAVPAHIGMVLAAWQVGRRAARAQRPGGDAGRRQPVSSTRGRT